jgi:zinc/manganese transport system substrate-binding protein
VPGLSGAPTRLTRSRASRQRAAGAALLTPRIDTQYHQGMRNLIAALAGLISIALLAWSPGLVAGQAVADQPTIVVTTEVLGSIVGELVGEDGEVIVLMEAGADPHTWQPSARDSEVVFGADLVVANGLELEEGLHDVLAQAEADGVPVFHAADHIPDGGQDAATDATEAAEDDHAEATPGAAGSEGPADGSTEPGDHGHEYHEGDPHIWLDPLAMREVVLALAPVLLEAGVDVDDRAAAMAEELTALDAELRATLAGIPAGQRRLVTGHGALGRFADRYGFEIVGTVIPGLSSADEPSARDIAQLVEAIRASGASAIFTDATTPPAVADAVAAETGARVIPISVERLPSSGRYVDLVRDVAAAIADGLGQ